MSESLIPPGKTATDLTVMELAYCSRNLKVDVLHAMSGDGGAHPMRVMALAYLALVWAKRKDPAAKLEDFTSLTFAELMPLLSSEEEPEEEPETLEEALEVNPTVSVPESQSLSRTDSTPAMSSP